MPIFDTHLRTVCSTSMLMTVQIHAMISGARSTRISSSLA